MKNSLLQKVFTVMLLVMACGASAFALSTIPITSGTVGTPSDTPLPPGVTMSIHTTGYIFDPSPSPAPSLKPVTAIAVTGSVSGTGGFIATGSLLNGTPDGIQVTSYYPGFVFRMYDSTGTQIWSSLDGQFIPYYGFIATLPGGSSLTQSALIPFSVNGKTLIAGTYGLEVATTTRPVFTASTNFVIAPSGFTGIKGIAQVMRGGPIVAPPISRQVPVVGAKIQITQLSAPNPNPFVFSLPLVSGTVVTDSNGQFQFAAPVGTFRVQGLKMAGLLGDTQTVTVTSGAATNVVVNYHYTGIQPLSVQPK